MKGREESVPGRALRILVVDDEEPIRQLLSVSLRFQHCEVATASDGREAVAVAPEFRPDVIVLDVMMPRLDGFATLERLRGMGVSAPVLFLTARDGSTDKVRGLTEGADDYVTKPFDLEEVVARIPVLLRRGPAYSENDGDRLRFADITLDVAAHRVQIAGETVELSPTEFSLLRYLMVNQGTVLPKARILAEVWQHDIGGDVNLVETYVSSLRRKLGAGRAGYIHTVRGVGYVLREA